MGRRGRGGVGEEGGSRHSDAATQERLSFSRVSQKRSFVNSKKNDAVRFQGPSPDSDRCFCCRFFFFFFLSLSFSHI